MPPPSSSIFEAAAHILVTLKRLSDPSDSFQWDGTWFGYPGSQLVDFYAGTPRFRELIDEGKSVAEIVAYFDRDVQDFTEIRKAFLIYE